MQSNNTSVPQINGQERASSEVSQINGPDRASSETAKQKDLPDYSQIFDDYVAANQSCLRNLCRKFSVHATKQSHIYNGLFLIIVGIISFYLAYWCLARNNKISFYDCTDVKNQCSDYSKNDYEQIINCYPGSLDNPFAICKECNNGCVVNRNKEKLCLPAKCGNHKGSIPHVLGLVVFCLIGVLCSPIGLIIIFEPPKQKIN